MTDREDLQRRAGQWLENVPVDVLDARVMLAENLIRDLLSQLQAVERERDGIAGMLGDAAGELGAVESALAACRADAETLLISAVRYALGRRSYIVGLTCDIGRRLNPSTETRRIIVRDIAECRDLGMAMDEREWSRFRSWLESSAQAVAEAEHIEPKPDPQ